MLLICNNQLFGRPQWLTIKDPTHFYVNKVMNKGCDIICGQRQGTNLQLGLLASLDGSTLCNN
jgi:hypothetical protein